VTYFKKIENKDARDKILRGVETYSRWGQSVGKYSDLPISWEYNKDKTFDKIDSWVENALWEWSDSSFTKGYPFVFQAGSDTHKESSSGSGEISEEEKLWYHPNPSGITAAYAIHNTRDEIWDAMHSNN
jgi:hypothetical protein